MGLPQHDEDFGQTLGVWGVNTGSYVFVPLLGPSTYRDVPGIPVSVFSNLLFYAGSVAGTAFVAPVAILSIIDKRARLSGPMRIRDQAALDPYLFVREGYLQQRKHSTTMGVRLRRVTKTRWRMLHFRTNRQLNHRPNRRRAPSVAKIDVWGMHVF